MTNIYNSAEGTQPFSEHAEVTSSVQIEGIEPAAATRATAEFAAATNTHPKEEGPLRVDASYDADRRQLKLSFAGSIATTSYLLDHRSAGGAGLIGERVTVSTVAKLDGIDRSTADLITNHLLSAAKNHPPQGIPLRIETDRETPGQMKVTLQGSAFAISYLLSIITLQLEQPRSARA